MKCSFLGHFRIIEYSYGLFKHFLCGSWLGNEKVGGLLLVGPRNTQQSSVFCTIGQQVGGHICFARESQGFCLGVLGLRVEGLRVD